MPATCLKCNHPATSHGLRGCQVKLPGSLDSTNFTAPVAIPGDWCPCLVRGPA